MHCKQYGNNSHMRKTHHLSIQVYQHSYKRHGTETYGQIKPTQGLGIASSVVLSISGSD